MSELDPTTDAFAFLPNWAFSTALAAFLQQKAASGAPAKTGAAVDPIAEGAKAVMQNPTIVPAVLEKCDFPPCVIQLYIAAWMCAGLID